MCGMCRVQLNEVLMMNEDLKGAVAAGARTDEIRDLAVKSGMRTLKDYNMTLMAQGLTAVDEVLTDLSLSK